MRKFVFLLVPLIFAFFTAEITPQTAKVQIIHNSADVLADSVDIYVNGALALNNFKFRTATNFLELPAGVTLNIGVAPATSTSVTDTIKNFPVVLSAGESYVVIANGLLTSGYAANPDGRNTAFTLFVKDMARESAVGSGVDLFVEHGSTDAPGVDVKVRELSNATIVNDAKYGDITDYINAPAQDVTLDLYLADGVTYVASFSAPLSALNGGAAAVFASGFLTPSANQNGAAFGLFVALPDGSVLQLPAASGPTAKVQVIHNSADVLADSVDVYVNGNLALDNFKFRTATNFLELPAGVKINIGVAAANSHSVTDTLKNFPIVLSAGEKYVVFANGLLTSGYAANPDGRNTAFTLFVKDMARESAVGSGVDLFVEHGSTDAPGVDVKVRELNATIVNDAKYGDITDYITAPAQDVILDIYLAGGVTYVASFSAPLSALNGGAAAVFASGFLTPSANQDGAAFGLFAALPNGTVIQLPAITTAKVQVIHNSADVSADSVDIYINDALTLNNFKFRTATPFVELPAGETLNIGVAPATSTSVTDTIKNFPVKLFAGEKYVVFANGVISPNNYAANPDGRSTAFTLFVKDMAREMADSTGVDLFVLHGSTDAPGVDVKVRELSNATIVNDAKYGDITDYFNAPAQNVTLDLYLEDGATYVASFSAPLSGLDKGAAAVFASGFLAPTTNQNGAAFGLFVALPDGSVLQLPAVNGPTSVENVKTVPNDYGLLQNYPNPFNPSTVISFNLPVESFVTLKVFNILGEQVANLIQNRLSAGTQQVNFNAAGLNSGVYFYKIEAKGIDGKDFTSVKKMILTK